MTTTTVPYLTLNSGVELPALGLGVFQTPPDETRDAVRAALDAGYRHIDTAAAYGNEREVGEAVHASGLDRSEVFLETKIWISDYGYDETLHGFEKSAGKLGVEQIDLLILHQALPSAFDRTLEAYRALETLLADGKVRAIGVSNFLVDHLTALLERVSIVPALNQIEVHPYFAQPEVQAFGAEHRILTQAWSPIGGITFYRDGQHTQHPPGPRHRRHCEGPWQEPGSGHAALGHPARTLRDPEVDQAPADRREHRRLRLRAHARPDRRDRRARHRAARRPGAQRHHAQGLRTQDPGGVTPLPAVAPNTDRRWVLRVAPDPYLRFDTCDYSLERMVGRRVEVRSLATGICPGGRRRTPDLPADVTDLVAVRRHRTTLRRDRPAPAPPIPAHPLR